MRGNGLPALLLAALLFVSGCISSSTRDEEAEAPPLDDAPASRPWEPNPQVGPQPVLLPATGWLETAWGYVAQDWTAPVEPVPVLLVSNGYQGAGHPTHYLRARDGTYLAVDVRLDDETFPGYAVATASVRGTGCSGGAFDLFDRTHAFDGYELVEWLAQEPWTTRVGISGHSYSGLTGFLIASTAPPSLAAVAVSGLIGDLYRGIAYPGGVPNVGFPVAWSAAYRPYSDAAGTVEGFGGQDEVCAFNVARRPPVSATQHFALKSADRTDDEWYRSRSLLTWAHGVRAPILIGHAWQDEQTGPRGGPEVFRAVAPEPVEHNGTWVVPKRLVAGNGVHLTSDRMTEAAALPWFDRFLGGVENGALDAPPVEVLLDVATGADGIGHSARLQDAQWPLAATNWTRFHLREAGALSTEAPEREEPDLWAAGRPARNWAFTDYLYYVDGRLPSPPSDLELRRDLPDVLAYRSGPLEAPMTVAGPIAATLYLSTTAPDVDLFVALSDVDPDGQVTPLQRGLLRASHRALDAQRTWTNDAGDVVRPWRPHVNPQPVAVTQTTEYVVEVFPLGHVFREGHRLQLQISTPPLADGLWGYDPVRLPGVNTLFHDEQRPSSILLPVVPLAEPAPAPECGAPDGYACLAPGPL